jgi:hypothetical protein
MEAQAMPGTCRGTALIAMLAAACGGPDPAFTVHGANVVVHSDAAFTRTSDFPERVESTLGAALAYWGGDWKALEGKTISFEGSQHVRCGGTPGAVGCYDGNIRFSTMDAGRTVLCVEETTLAHEVGHAVIGDAAHTDPRWLDFASLARALDGRQGYADHGDAPCAIFVSLWRHPPDHTGD